MMQRETTPSPRPKVSRKGFTLLEVMVGSGIFTLIMTLIMVAYVASQREFITGFTRLSMNREARMAMDWMRRDLKSGARFLATLDSGGVTYNFVEAGQTLIFEIPTIDGAGNLSPGNFDGVIYTLTAGQLIRLVDPGAGSSQPTNVVMANDVQNIAFSRLASVSRVDVTIETGRTVLGGRLVEALVGSAFTLRNL